MPLLLRKQNRKKNQMSVEEHTAGAASHYCLPGTEKKLRFSAHVPILFTRIHAMEQGWYACVRTQRNVSESQH